MVIVVVVALAAAAMATKGGADMGTSPFVDRPPDDESAFLESIAQPRQAEDRTPMIPRPQPPAPTRGTPLRDIAKSLKTSGDDAARARILGGPNTLDEIAGKLGKPPSQTESLFNLGASSAMDPSEKLYGSAAGTNAQRMGDDAFAAIRSEQNKRSLESEQIEREREKVAGGDPMEREIEAEKQAREFEGMLPYGTRPVEKIGLPGEEMGDFAPSEVPVGEPTYGEARKYAEARGVAEARGAAYHRGSGAAGGPGSSTDIGGRRIQLTEQMQKDLKIIDTDQTLSQTEREKRREALLRRAAVVSDILSGHGGSGYFARPSH